MTTSKAMENQGAAIPHLSKGEIADLRSDVDEAFAIAELITDKVSVTATEIKALVATPKTLVAAEGAGTVLELVSATLRLVSGSEALAEDAGGSNLGIKYTDGSGTQVSEAIEMTGFITEAANATTFAKPAATAPIDTGDTALNAPLVLHNIGAGEITGNASDDAVLEVYISYKIHRSVSS